MRKLFSVAVLCGLAIAGCATAPSTRGGQQQLDDQARQTISQMKYEQPGLDNVLRNAAGYAVFPSIGRGGAIIAGGAYGKGVLYEHGQAVGYVSLSQASIGPQLGGDTFAEILVVPTRDGVDRIKGGRFDIGGDVSVIVLKAGAHGTAEIATNTTVFVMTHGGLMANLSVTGQQINYEAGG